ncbi:MAG: NUDIX hydrolase [Candidatus Woesearchaeota archaeon]
MSSQIEYLDFVDDTDNVVGRASKNEVYEKKLRHRICHVLILNNKGDMALQLRSSTVNFCPNHWSTAVGGHVQSGETYEQGAIREYQEELGTTSNLKLIGIDSYSNDGTPDKFLATFKTIYEGPFQYEEGKVTKVEYFSIDEIKSMIKNGEKFHPELLFILKKYYF